MTRRARWLAFAALAVFVAVGVALRLPHEAVLAALGAAVALGAGVALVHSGPLAAPAWATVAAAGVATLGAGTSSNVGWFGVCVLVIWTLLVADVRVGVACWAASLMLFGVEWVAHHDPGWGAWAAGTTLSAGAALMIRRERLLLEQLRAAQVGLAERSRAEERERIARELHDVIAHSLTVSLLHVSSARLAVQHDPADAARALEEAERLGRQSLSEVRSIMGRSREADGGIAAPAPRIDGVQELVEQFRGAGVEVSLTVSGDLEQVPATTGSTAYRIAQESLTNAVKHAPGTAVAVRLSAGPRGVELTVDSAGAPGTGAGMGVAAMGERARAVGGRCAAGPQGSGWRVHATLPGAGGLT